MSWFGLRLELGVKVMVASNVLKKSKLGEAADKREWLNRLEGLVTQINEWANDFDWSTRRITKKLSDSEIGEHTVPALILQKETARVLLEPIARSAPGVEGVVDLYLMPAYDDIASLFFVNGKWQLHYVWTGAPTVTSPRKEKPKPLSASSLRKVLEDLVKNAAAA